MRPYGHADSIVAMSSVAAPLLAGFSITCVTLAVQWYERFRCLGLRLLSVASVVLLMAVQYGFWARRAQRSYSLGVVIFLAGLGLVVGEGMALVPPATPVRGWQPGPLAVFAAAIGYELLWVSASWITAGRKADDSPWATRRTWYAMWVLAGSSARRRNPMSHIGPRWPGPGAGPTASPERFGGQQVAPGAGAPLSGQRAGPAQAEAG